MSGSSDYFYIFFFVWLGLVLFFVTIRRLCILMIRQRRMNNMHDRGLPGAHPVVADAVVLPRHHDQSGVYIINDGDEHNSRIITAKPEDIVVVGSQVHGEQGYNSLYGPTDGTYYAEAYSIDENSRRI